jgi:hypothetical protein
VATFDEVTIGSGVESVHRRRSSRPFLLHRLLTSLSRAFLGPNVQKMDEKPNANSCVVLLPASLGLVSVLLGLVSGLWYVPPPSPFPPPPLAWVL